MNIVKRYTSLLLLLTMGVAMLLSPFFNVDCASNPVLSISRLESGEITNIKNAISDINSELEDLGYSDWEFILFKESDDSTNDNKTYNLELDMAAYNNMTQEGKQEVMKSVLLCIDNSSISKINRSKIYNFISNNDKATSNLVRQLSDDVTADFASAYSSFKPFTGTIGWILGVLTLAIFVFLGLTITVDIAYIVVPIIQYGLSKDNNNVKPKYVSLEAWNAVKQAESNGKFSEPLSIYFKLKSKQFIALGVCLLYLISGKIYTLIAWFMDMFSGVLPN